MVVATVGIVVTAILSGTWSTLLSFNPFVIVIGIVSAFVASLLVIAVTVLSRLACPNCGRRVDGGFLLCPYCGVRLK
ncbi:MAG: zinc ribbon domain-containing protein [Methanobacteriota archaeon]|nr:MAG: zinc ribbon domain-containing protein [Euryarchaeota archaeon]